jgi:cytochrome c556
VKYSTLIKNLPTGFVEEADAMSEKELRDLIVDSENNIRITNEEKENNEGFKAAKDSYKDAAAPFRDAIKAQQAKIAYALNALESKGKL